MRNFWPIVLIAVLIISGCGSSGGGSSHGTVTITANPSTVTGTSYDSGHQRKWNWQMTFSETGGVTVALTQYVHTIVGSNGYRPDPETGSQPISISAHSQQTLSFEIFSGSEADGTPRFSAGTSHWQFTGTDAHGNSVTAEITVTLQ